MDGSHKHEFSVPPAQLELEDLPFTLNSDERAFFQDVISEDEAAMKARIESVRKLAFSHYPYPCIRRYHFINLMMMQNPVYPSVVEAGRRGDAWFLDIGCCMGTDVRKLVSDGYPAANVAGCDLRSTFMDIGRKELFRDEERCEVAFFAADVFDVTPAASGAIDAQTNSSPGRNLSLRDFLRSSGTSDEVDVKLASLQGWQTHIYVGALFHLFDEPTQRSLALRLASLLKDEPGSIIFGRHQGKEEAGDLDDGVIGATTFRYGHSASSWIDMWHRAYEDITGAEYARDHVRVRAEFIEYRRGLTDSWLVWSVTHL